GIVDLGDGLALTFKIESHNHPSFIEPFQGAATGVGGILRDIFTMGARPIAVLDSLRFADPGDAKARRLLEGVVSGISWYGNCFGVPNLGGEVGFAPEYAGNPLVNAMAVGLVRRDRILRPPGLPGACSEMPARAGTGMEVDLERVPQRERGMTPYEIMLSESQERMLLVCARGREAEIRAVFAKWDLDAVEIGRVTGDGILRARMDGEVVAEWPVKVLADEAPVYEKPVARPDWQDGLEAFDPLTLPPVAS